MPGAYRASASSPSRCAIGRRRSKPSPASARRRARGLAELAEAADIVVECLPSQHFAAVAGPAIKCGRIFVPLSVGALIDHMALVERARETGARIIVPTGALLGLDAVRAAAEGRSLR